VHLNIIEAQIRLRKLEAKLQFFHARCATSCSRQGACPCVSEGDEPDELRWRIAAKARSLSQRMTSVDGAQGGVPVKQYHCTNVKS
jgi:hypothetical protein